MERMLKVGFAIAHKGGRDRTCDLWVVGIKPGRQKKETKESSQVCSRPGGKGVKCVVVLRGVYPLPKPQAESVRD